MSVVKPAYEGSYINKEYFSFATHQGGNSSATTGSRETYCVTEFEARRQAVSTIPSSPRKFPTLDKRLRER